LASNNPFTKNGNSLPVASINSVYVDDELASNIFRPSLLLEEIIKYKNELGLTNESDSGKYLYMFNDLLKSDLDSIRSKAYEIAEEFGNRLSKVLLTLYKPSLKSVLNRENWTDEHWQFWKTITNIYLVGGLTSPILTSVFYSQVTKALEANKIDNLTVTFIEGSANLGTQGLSTLITDGDYLLFDFGQTNIKRARHMKKNNKVVIETVLPQVKSDYLFYKSKSEDEVKQIAHLLDDYIVNTIANTIKQVAYQSGNIYMSIANYVSEGKIYSARGGYGKLAYVSDNYEKHLSNRLSKLYNRDIKVKLFHDTSAMALVFKNRPNTAVISLGTAFGIAFPE